MGKDTIVAEQAQHYSQPNEEHSEVLIVTGYSGAGKSTVLRALEDMGFFCVDNLPIGLLSPFFQMIGRSRGIGQKVALGIDIRGGNSVESIIELIKQAQSDNLCTIKIFFLSSSSDILRKRFQETRRKHPLSHNLDINDAINHEKILLKPLIAIADIVLQTDQLKSNQLRQTVRNLFGLGAVPQLVVHLISFGFKYGVPHDCNFVYDIRSLPNPFFIPALRMLDGLDSAVKEYLFSQPEVQEYWQQLCSFLTYSIDKSYQEGRFFITIAIGCTGGRHRSVAFVEQLAKITLNNVTFMVTHRDIAQDNYVNGEQSG